MWWSGWRDYFGGSTPKVPRPDEEREAPHPLRLQAEVAWLSPEWQTERVRSGRIANQLPPRLSSLKNRCLSRISGSPAITSE
jgi:hypothetical protein